MVCYLFNFTQGKHPICLEDFIYILFLILHRYLQKNQNDKVLIVKVLETMCVLKFSDFACF